MTIVSEYFIYFNAQPVAHSAFCYSSLSPYPSAASRNTPVRKGLRIQGLWSRGRLRVCLLPLKASSWSLSPPHGGHWSGVLVGLFYIRTFPSNTHPSGLVRVMEPQSPDNCVFYDLTFILCSLNVYAYNIL